MARHLIQQSRSLFSIPVFLAPALSTSSPASFVIRSFSSSSIAHDQVKRGNRDKNKKRGVSVIRSTGPRQPLSVERLGPLPKPVADPSEARAAFEVDPNHGLWGFFNANKEAVIPPGEETSHGRPWAKVELARKNWEDLHKLYWVCIKEMNVVRTRLNERRRLRIGYGQTEAGERVQNLKTTMLRIRQVLLERHYAHFDAGLLLQERYLYELFPEILQQNVPPTDLGLEEPVVTEAQPDAEILLSTKDSIVKSSRAATEAITDSSNQQERVTK